MNTCRLCKKDRNRSLVKYGPRHYAHADCALDKWGASFFDRLALCPLENLPYMLIHERGLHDAYMAALELRRAGVPA